MDIRGKMTLMGSGEVHILLGSLAAPSKGLPAGPQVARFRKLGCPLRPAPYQAAGMGRGTRLTTHWTRIR